MIEEEQKKSKQDILECLGKHKVSIDQKAIEIIISQGDEYARLLQSKIIDFSTNSDYQHEKERAFPIGEKEIMVLLQKIKDPEKEMVEEEDLDFTYLDSKGNEKISIPKIVNNLLNKYSFKTIYYLKAEKVYFYEKGIWNNRGIEIIKTETEKLLQDKCVSNIVKEVVEKIKRLTAISQEEFDTTPEELICLENGILNTTTKEFMNHDPKFYFKTKIPIEYDETVDCPKIKEFLENMVYPEDFPVIQEWFGFQLYKRYFIKKAMIIFGETDTGKTILLNLLMSFLGKKENTSGISLQRISSGDKFALSSLKDKFANIFDDLSAKDLSDSGGFKIATGGGYITAEYKFGDPFQFLTFAKNIFATNKIPSVKDIDDDAYYSRWIPIPFDNQIKEEEQDKFILKKLTTEKEMSGLLNWALDGLKRLLINGSFSYSKNSEEIKSIMLRQNNPLIAFAQDVLIQEADNKISKEVMYQIYSKYCDKYKFPKMSKEQLGRNLKKYVYYIGSVGGNERSWVNVKVNDTYDTLIFNDFDKIEKTGKKEGK